MAENFSEDQIAEFRQAFNEYDQDGGGSISTNELGVAMRSLGACPTEEELEKWVDEVDVNGDGELDFEEFLNLMAKMSGRDPLEELANAFKVFDRSGEGLVNARELRHVLTKMGDLLSESEVDEWLINAQIDDKGNIDIEQFLEQFFSFMKPI
mmetsp:Transcript_1947/g.3635  ORF Transcript_1947/g.3635 Transcript_1947/m.3635 type:complete len:153 (+) Transcript_1947:59-517(+)|eukprot:CAMPEP_0197646954 /NCGR_PEP_ID=MMETSP1338-20131121/23953_1 /TAXON_ID=43686 ORGANISM="Pelagodinium beii, Strain RCC1491" /NCGR_SAMPLE_ID=MMETSP1338 /ASSEMBLY_ACC=CAM_ASM_000754 /LENGTH=152 /DNA_ID=CAMNT_0043220645 /DNA_START=59 /DNA_END=517 /DNA_ORIENTATION=-